MVALASGPGMPSTLVHVALAALIAVALLGDALDGRALLVVLAATAAIDLDAVLGLYLPGAHRAALHTYLLPVALSALLYYDVRVREASALASWRPDAPRIAAVAVLALAVAGIGLDMVHNGVNVFYPLHDQFYTVDGRALLSDRRGFVQSFVELEPPGPPADGGQPRTTENVHYSTGVDPSAGDEPADVERVFPLVSSGRELLLVVLGYGSAGARLYERRLGEA